MTTDTQTLNPSADVTGAADSSPASGNFEAFVPTMPEDSPQEPDSSAETQNTVPETEETAEQPSEDTKAAETEEAKPADEAETSESEPFHKHPRFQQLISKNKDLEKSLQEMQGQMQAMAKQASPGGESSDLEAQFAEVSRKLEDGDISMSEALAKQRELIEASSSQRIDSIMQEQQRQAEAARIQEKFLADNPDFEELKNSGDLEAIVQTNPLHDMLSAYYAHKAEQVQKESEKQVKDAVSKAVKETEERMRKEFQSKRNAASLSDSAAHVPSNSGQAAELKDTSKFGGVVPALASRLKAMREARAGRS